MDVWGTSDKYCNFLYATSTRQPLEKTLQMFFAIVSKLSQVPGLSGSVNRF